MNNLQNKDENLWKIARNRADFKKRLLVYLFVNLFLWSIWVFSIFRNGIHFPWPVFPTVGWGIGIFFNWLGAYHNDSSLAEREYNKLIEREA